MYGVARQKPWDENRVGRQPCFVLRCYHYHPHTGLTTSYALGLWVEFIIEP